jgi:hypothetical protein
MKSKLTISCSRMCVNGCFTALSWILVVLLFMPYIVVFLVKRFLVRCYRPAFKYFSINNDGELELVLMNLLEFTILHGLIILALVAIYYCIMQCKFYGILS